MTLTVARATQADRAEIEALVAASYGHYVERLGKPPGPMLADYAGQIAAGLVRVAKEGDSVLGLLVLIPRGDHLLLENVAVSPRAQGRGLGKRLMAEAENSARESGFGTIRLYTHEKMVENIGIYTRLGYAETHRVTENGFDRVYMEKRLG